MPTEDRLYEGKNEFESKLKIRFSYPFAGIWEHVP